MNGQVKHAGRSASYRANRTASSSRAPRKKKIDVFDGQNPNRTLWSGSLLCKDESQAYSITGVGGTVTVRPVAAGGPRGRIGSKFICDPAFLIPQFAPVSATVGHFPPALPPRADDTDLLPGPPTRVRYSVLAFLCTLSMITYIDRAFWGSAQEDIREELGLKTVADLAIALWAFQLAYALFEVPTGYLGDRYGPRKTLIRIVLWWSFFFCLTTLVGYRVRRRRAGRDDRAGGAGRLPVPVRHGRGGGVPEHRARRCTTGSRCRSAGTAQGAVWMSARFMGGLTPLIWLCLVDPEVLGLHWKTGFWIFGGVGLLWCLAFALWFRNTPEEHPATNQAERDLIAVGPRAGAGPRGRAVGEDLPQPEPLVRLRHVRLHQLRLVLLHVLPAGLPEAALRRPDRHPRRPDRDGAHGRRAAAGRGARAACSAAT